MDNYLKKQYKLGNISKEQLDMFEQEEKMYKLNRELIKKIEKLKPIVAHPSFFETNASTPDYDIRVFVTVAKRG